MKSLVTASQRASSLLLASVLVGCGWHSEGAYPSPDKRGEVNLLRLNGYGAGIKASYMEKTGEYTIFKQYGEIFHYLTEVFWSPDGRLIGVFTCGQPLIRVGYDRRAKSVVPFSEVESGLQKQLRRRYEIPSSEKDAFGWTCLHVALGDLPTGSSH